MGRSTMTLLAAFTLFIAAIVIIAVSALLDADAEIRPNYAKMKDDTPVIVAKKVTVKMERATLKEKS